MTLFQFMSDNPWFSFCALVVIAITVVAVFEEVRKMVRGK